MSSTTGSQNTSVCRTRCSISTGQETSSEALCCPSELTSQENTSNTQSSYDGSNFILQTCSQEPHIQWSVEQVGGSSPYWNEEQKIKIELRVHDSVPVAGLPTSQVRSEEASWMFGETSSSKLDVQLPTT